MHVAEQALRRGRRVVDDWAPGRGETERRIAAANIRCMLMASTWHPYRAHFRFGLDESIACAEAAIDPSLDALDARRARRLPKRTGPPPRTPR